MRQNKKKPVELAGAFYRTPDGKEIPIELCSMSEMKYLIVKIGHIISRKDRELIHSYLKKAVGDDVQVIIADGTIEEMKILR